MPVACDDADGLSLRVPVADETSALVTLAARGATASPGGHFLISDAHQRRRGQLRGRVEGRRVLGDAADRDP